ncbi:MAG TPA: HEAT repeat domain-containing protein [Catenuloplanes sp.]|jgi:HEAT repeat protein
MLTVATVSLVVLLIGICLLAALIAGIRVLRTLRDRRRAALAEGPRRALLAFVADGGEQGADELVAIGARAWQAAEPAAIALLGKVRGEAQQALIAVFERRGVATRAMRDLTAHGVTRRARAVEVLGNLERADAVPALCQLLDDRHSAVRVVAVRALGRIGDPAAAPYLIASLARAEPTPALLVTQALAQLGAGGEPTLQAALDHSLPRVRAGALDALGLLGATGTVARVAAVLRDDPHLDVRVAAVSTLGRFSTRAALAPLVDALDPAHPGVLRAAAAHALGELGAPAAVAPLAGLLTDPRYRVAHEAAHALRRLGTAGLRQLRTVAADDAAPGADHAREALALAAITAGSPDPAAAPTQSLAVTA